MNIKAIFKYGIMRGNPFLIVVLLIGLIGQAQNIHGSFESKFKRYQKGERFQGESTLQWEAVAWKGERINKQIVLWSDSPHENLEYRIESFKSVNDGNSTIDTEFISWRFPSYVKGDTEARSCTTVAEGQGFDSIRPFVEIADALIETPVNTIPINEPLKIWLTIDVPVNQTSGKYVGSFVVSQGEKELKTFTINLQVLDYELPKPKDWNFHLDIWQWPLQPLEYYNMAEDKKIKAWSKEHFELLKPFYKALANMGQKVIFTQINDSKSPLVKWIRDDKGNWSFNFEAFDAYVAQMQKWGIRKQISCHVKLGSKHSDLPYYSKGEEKIKHLSLKKWSPEYNSIWKSFLNNFKAHLIKKGWYDKTTLFFDELRQEEMIDLIDFMQGFDPDWNLAMAYGHVQSEKVMNLLSDASGILGVANNTGRKEKTNTFYTSCTETIPNNYVTPVNNVAEMTWMPWHAAREGFDGYLRWAYDYWTKEDPFDTRDGGFTSGDFSMVYRSKNGKGMKPIMGIRTEMLREGIQDFEKIEILRRTFRANGDSLRLKKINDVVNLFSASSGSQALELVSKAQKTLEQLSLKKEIQHKAKTLKNNVEVKVNKDINEITITTKKAVFEVEILTYEGKRIYLQQFEQPNNGSEIKLSNLVPDYYLIRVVSKNEVFVEVVYFE
ncbi:DUF4091 domain-containing protein [Seonamhaeicola sp.]|uniref:DUF4091 domain-containing protein n=1 Tax=Seonamhaeicola sp. TaxID=1912245 RepID=UPI00261597E2|nr:DUF4091 domain-containing protein [Seonamhaeicola sp.]